MLSPADPIPSGVCILKRVLPLLMITHPHQSVFSVPVAAQQQKTMHLHQHHQSTTLARKICIMAGVCFRFPGLRAFQSMMFAKGPLLLLSLLS